MSKDEVVKLRIEGIVAGGAGKARLEGKTVFVDGCAPDETVLCRVTEDHNSWARAQLLEIVEASAARTEPACAFYGICGGCNLQHIDYETQLAAKAAILKESFSRIGGITPPEPEVVPSEQWEYRNRVQFHCMKNDRANFGFMGRKSGQIIAVSDCPIADPGIRKALQTCPQSVRESLSPEKDRFTVYSRGGLLLSEGGTGRGKIQLLEKEIAIDAGVFFQSNGMMLEKLIADLREIANTDGSARSSLAMADIYCGVGTYAAFLGEMFAKTDLVEENKTALGLARENVKGQDSGFYACRDRDWIKQKKNKKQDYGFIIADPPRQGMARELASWLAGQNALIAYVSCDPASLCRDSKILAAGGYRLSRLVLYDFYPQTSHIESMAVFDK